MMPEIAWQIGIGIALLAFVAEYIDSTLGMGYGTTLTPLLMLLFGLEPLQIVPAILLSELVTGLLAGFTHHSVGNVELRPRTMHLGKILASFRQKGIRQSVSRGLPMHLKIALALSICSVVGTVISVVLAVKLPSFYVKLYIGVLVTVIGVVILITRNKTYPFGWKKIWGLGLIASFNKGISGGGYGPVVTGGQLLAGVDGKPAVGITSLAEGLTCVVGVIAYLLTSEKVDWGPALYLIAGGVISVPLSALTVKKVPAPGLRIIIGVTTLILGAFTLSKLL